MVKRHCASRAILSALALVLLAPAIAPADPPPARAKPATKPEDVYAADPILPLVKCDGAPFSDTIDFLRDVSGANIFVDWKRLEAMKIDRHAPITLNLKNVHFRKAMESMLAEVGSDANRPAFAADGQLVVISTPAGLKAIADSAQAMAATAMSPALRVKLDRRLPEVRFDGVGLSDVLDFMRDVSGLSIEGDWKALAEAGVGRDDPISARLFNLPLGQVLRIIAGDLDGRKPVGIAIQDDKVIVAPVADRK